jgi:hypothetical protein
VTYSPEHVADGQRLTQLLTKLEHELTELRQMVSIYEDAVTMPGRRRSGVDADGTGRQATHGPSRPTERIVLDGARGALQRELNSGAAQLPYAVAVVRGVIASMDRALSRWEGEDEVQAPGGLL